jgi:hypothetical protein
MIMNKVRRAGMTLLATALGFGLITISSPAQAFDTSWGRGTIVSPTSTTK